ncbi:MAG: HD domain-containing protein [Patescibacteria group bacterium]|nr:HD domain-containing protein [Patescibacteria group bacterium]
MQAKEKKSIDLRVILAADKLAKKLHEGQLRKNNGEPYANHPERVAELVAQYKTSHRLEDLLAAAMLHDTIEDTDYSKEEIEEKFNKLVASLVEELTSDEKELKKKGKANYLTEKMLKMSNWGLTIKLADRLDNVSDLNDCPKEFAERYTKETKQILDVLEEKRELTNAHKELIKAIREKI